MKTTKPLANNPTRTYLRILCKIAQNAHHYGMPVNTALAEKGKRMAKYLLFVILLGSTSILHAAETIDEVILWNTPEWVAENFEKSGLQSKYRFSSKINPFYLRGDFDGDGVQDISILIEEIKTNKIGIAVFHSKSHKIHIIGAGAKLGNGGDDYKWMDMWSVYKKQAVGQGVGEGEPPTLMSEALYVGKSEAASAIVYWDGKKYVWYQQGD